ncbi:unnamed protein product [Soboliphyme baturini]|uniref:protein-synthesizing GTPase n=1 Tax=Soboliphyme baturini TaxID=241478 RepID=A0A183J079_9BILA|nr:unnamed protein product [Soboliphyme baturini]
MTCLNVVVNCSSLSLEYSVLQLPRLTSKHSLASVSSEKVKNHFNVGTIGHIDHGKTTLTSAITRVLAKSGGSKYVPFEDIDKAPEERARGITISIAHIGYESSMRHYAHTDCPGHRDFIKNMICGASQMDAAILVMDASEGVMPQTREHLMLAKQFGVDKIVVFVNKAETADAEMLDLVQIEIRETLSEYGFDGNETPLICGSALLALHDDQSEFGEQSIRKLIDALDKLDEPQRAIDAPLLMPISSSVSITGRGTVIIGTLEQGMLKKGDKVELVGSGKVLTTTVSDIHVFKKSVPEVKAGDHVGVLCRKIPADNVHRGMWLVAPHSVQLYNHFAGQGYFFTEAECGCRFPAIRTGFTQKLMCTTWHQTSRLILDKSKDMVMQGDHFALSVVMQRPMPLKEGLHFTILEGTSTMISGKVTKLLPTIKNILSLKDLKTIRTSSS